MQRRLEFLVEGGFIFELWNLISLRSVGVLCFVESLMRDKYVNIKPKINTINFRI